VSSRAIGKHQQCSLKIMKETTLGGCLETPAYSSRSHGEKSWEGKIMHQRNPHKGGRNVDIGGQPVLRLI